MSTLEPLVPEGPLRFGDMVVGTFRYLRRNPAATLGIGALLGTVTSTITGIMVDGFAFGGGRGADVQRLLSGETLTAAEVQKAADAMPALLPYLGAASAVAVIAQLIAMGVMTVGMVQALRGEQVVPATLWRVVPWARVVGINLLVLALVLVAVLATSLPVLALGAGAIVPFMLLGGLIALVISTVASLAVPACVIEGLGTVASLRAAWRLTRRRLVSTTGLVLASVLFWTVVGDIIGQPVGSLLGTLAGGGSSTSGSVLASMVTQIIAAAISLPAASGMAVLVYRDRQQRAQ